MKRRIRRASAIMLATTMVMCNSMFAFAADMQTETIVEEQVTTEDTVETQEVIAEESAIEQTEQTEQIEQVEQVVESNGEQAIVQESEESSLIGEYIDEVDVGDAIVKYELTEDAVEDTIIAVSETDDGTEVIYVATEQADVTVMEEVFDIVNSFAFAAEAPSIEDNSWDNYVYTYDYSYDNSSAAQWGAWGGNGNLQGQIYPDTNNNDISNKIGVFTDGDKVDVYVSYASMFSGTGNGNDYNITINGENVKYRVVLEDGTDLSQASLTPGTYNLKIINGDGSISGADVIGAYGQIVIKENNCNNEMQISIPISSMQQQNENISAGDVTFHSPNIMRGSVSCSGASTMPIVPIVFAFIAFSGYLVYYDKQRQQLVYA